MRRQADGHELVAVERFVEEAAFVAEHLRLQHQATGQVGLDDLHQAASVNRPARARAGEADTGRSHSWPTAAPARAIARRRSSPPTTRSLPGSTLAALGVSRWSRCSWTPRPATRGYRCRAR